MLYSKLNVFLIDACISVLSSALESGADAVSTVNMIELERANRDLFLAQKTAERRSGARGADARKQLLAAEVRQKE